jgi:hypothetical protein
VPAHGYAAVLGRLPIISLRLKLVSSSHQGIRPYYVTAGQTDFGAQDFGSKALGSSQAAMASWLGITPTIRTRLSTIYLKLTYPPKPAFLQSYSEERPS